MIMNGKELAEKFNEKNRQLLQSLGKKLSLMVVIVGNDPASEIYVRNKQKACEKIGVTSLVCRMPEDTPQFKLNYVLDQLSRDNSINGILLQLPLPKGLNEREALSHIVPWKDVDGFNNISLGELITGTHKIEACTPKGIMKLLEEYQIPLDGKNAVVIGRSNIVGKPISMLLLEKNCTVTMCHSHTQNLKEIVRNADIVVVAIGSPKFVTADMIKPGAVVIDVGINRVDGKICGDVDFDNVKDVAGYITPVPGGVGPMTVAMLLDNLIILGR